MRQLCVLYVCLCSFGYKLLPSRPISMDWTLLKHQFDSYSIFPSACLYVCMCIYKHVHMYAISVCSTSCYTNIILRIYHSAEWRNQHAKLCLPELSNQSWSSVDFSHPKNMLKNLKRMWIKYSSQYNKYNQICIDATKRCMVLILHDDVIKGNISRVTGPLWGESTGHRWIPLTKASDAELSCFLWSAPEQTLEQTIMMSRSLWCHSNVCLADKSFHNVNFGKDVRIKCYRSISFCSMCDMKSSCKPSPVEVSACGSPVAVISDQTLSLYICDLIGIKITRQSTQLLQWKILIRWYSGINVNFQGCDLVYPVAFIHWHCNPNYHPIWPLSGWIYIWGKYENISHHSMISQYWDGLGGWIVNTWPGDGPLTTYVKLRVMHAPGMPGTFSPPPRVSDPGMHHGTCVVAIWSPSASSEIAVTYVPWCMTG